MIQKRLNKWHDETVKIIEKYGEESEVITKADLIQMAKAMKGESVNDSTRQPT